MSEKPFLKVVTGILTNELGQVLLLQRRPDQVEGGTWSFPGGKVEPEETHALALVRELSEEIGVTVTRFAPFVTQYFEYPDRIVDIAVFEVEEYAGVPKDCEGETLRWFDLADLKALAVPKANEPIITKLVEVRQNAESSQYSSASQ